ncbi:MAG TPA: HD-GYP domain-containing protein [Deltaproteobacteria bacterium]|jgi:HD-GYP domain-containing protein (c-di-GMP phosphodiesterase class II)|nr:HD-GYP domain-containing protein [Deltaproteobacteria bacterium]HQI02464.1 HD-GYP domain-containing protein [Deltaproteobacteria bacterium]HQJ08778.1 HD-GYP domain-containing protein [Deltaproteobacteria bacterium]
MYYKEIPYKLACIEGKTTTDLYFKVRDAYRLFAAEGATLTEDQRLLGRNQPLFIQCEDHSSAERDLGDHILRVLTDSSVAAKVRADLVYSLSMRSMRKVFQGTNTRTIQDLRKISNSVVRSILKEKDIVGHVMEMTSIDHYILQHSVKAGTFGLALTINMFGDRLDDHDLADLCTAFFLHDVGMTKVPRSVVDKEGPLTLSEWDVIRNHPLWGHDKLSKITTLTEGAASIVLYHHERCNGSGYPFKKTGGEIPIYAKICAIADTFESLTAKRPFRPSKTPFEALKIMQREMADEFDPGLFQAFVMLLGSG